MKNEIALEQLLKKLTLLHQACKKSYTAFLKKHKFSSPMMISACYSHPSLYELSKDLYLYHLSIEGAIPTAIHFLTELKKTPASEYGNDKELLEIEAIFTRINQLEKNLTLLEELLSRLPRSEGNLIPNSDWEKDFNLNGRVLNFSLSVRPSFPLELNIEEEDNSSFLPHSPSTVSQNNLAAETATICSHYEQEKKPTFT